MSVFYRKGNFGIIPGYKFILRRKEQVTALWEIAILYFKVPCSFSLVFCLETREKKKLIMWNFDTFVRNLRT